MSPMMRSRAAVAAIELLGSSPVKKTGTAARAANKPPMSKLIPLNRYSVVDDMVYFLCVCDGSSISENPGNSEDPHSGFTRRLRLLAREPCDNGRKGFQVLF